MEAGALRAPAAINRVSVTAPLLRLRTDEQLVALFRAGNDAAFSVIHDRYRQRLFAYSRQMLGGSRQDAEDALQDVFLRAYSSLRTSDRPVSLRAWLYRVAHNRCIDQLRRPAPAAADLFDTSRKPLHDPITESERRDDLRRLIEDVRRLPELQRSALLMREIDGMSYMELGEALGVSLPAVKSLLVRARIGLVEAVEARDTACADIRDDLADSFGRGVRASGLARRHLRDCDGCVDYRAQLRSVRKGLSALAPGGGPLTGLMHLLGLGGAGSAGAATAGGAASAGGGAIAVAGGGTAAKVAAVVCCAALTAGGAVEVREIVTPSEPGTSSSAKQRARSSPLPASTTFVPAQRAVATSAAASATSIPAARTGADGGERRTPTAVFEQRAAPASPGNAAGATPAPGEAGEGSSPLQESTGGMAAPDEDSGFGQGVDGLTPRRDDPAPSASAPVGQGQTADAGTGASAGGGHVAPPHEPAAGGAASAPVSSAPPARY